MALNRNDQYTFHRSYEKFLRDYPPEALTRATCRQRLMMKGDDTERARLQWETSACCVVTSGWQRISDQFPLHQQKLARHVVDQVRRRIPVSCPPEYDLGLRNVHNAVVLHVLLEYPKPTNEAFERLLSESRVPKPNPVGTGRPGASPSRLDEAGAADASAPPPPPPPPPLPQLTLRELVATSVPDQERPSRPTRTVAPGPPDPIDYNDSTDPIPEPAWMKRLLESGNEDDDGGGDDDEKGI
ncbi:Ff.00g056880.m01.CDS01 [Fusarium sp. VM40]|nr:Ff.00g056880.m01.CDS01 [Fusarium sp. VM40]